ncbi:MAG: hypothetical protein B6229_10840 [Spirochaetaceae bacterium 4572_7]|nr:MAG: hypothetical protein B6229_10840 [Spirochaetaceae bacterium 4572_7]
MSTDIEFYRNQFYQEARDLLENVSENILKVEVDQDDESILNVIFRDIHTIKGSAGGFDLDLISEFSHNLEGLLDALRAKDISINGVFLIWTEILWQSLVHYMKHNLQTINLKKSN